MRAEPWQASLIAGQLSLSVSAPSQHAALAAYTGPQEVIQDMVDIYAERRTYMFERLKKLGFKIYGGEHLGCRLVWAVATIIVSAVVVPAGLSLALKCVIDVVSAM